MRETGPLTCVIAGVVSKLLYATDSGVDTTDAVAADVSDEFRRLVRDYPFPGKAPLDRDEPSSRRHPPEQRGRPFQKQLDIRRQRYYLRCASAVFVSRKICFTELGRLTR